MCILLSVKLLWCSGIPYISGQLEGGPSALSICALCYIRNLFGVVVLHRCMVNWRWGGLGICAFCYMWNLFGVVVLHRSMVNWRWGGVGICAFCFLWNFCGVVVFHTFLVNWRGVHLPSVYVHCAICETYLWCSGISYIYDQLQWGGTSAITICAFCSVLNLFGVVVFHRSVVNWRGYICPKYMCILLYVKFLRCSSIQNIYGQLEGVHLP